MGTEKITSYALTQFEDHLANCGIGVKKIASMFERAGIDTPQVPDGSGVRRRQIEACYKSLDLSKWSDVKKLLEVFECVLLDLTKDGAVQSEATWKHLIGSVQRDGFAYTNNRFVHPHMGSADAGGADGSSRLTPTDDRFAVEFPAGLPFGKDKPSINVGSSGGRAVPEFEPSATIRVLRSGIYPDLDFAKFTSVIEGAPDESAAQRMKQMIWDMNQTPCEKEFLSSYANTFRMVTSHVPALVPQAWIQWHSSTKRNLRDQGSKHADRLLRVDFVAFWGGRRFVILVDDRGHYAMKNGDVWIPSDELYSKRLKEDRWLRKERWEVFRVSNWEMRERQALGEIMQDFREFVGF